ncbi:tagatose kinase [Aureimonas psammosilenae]|uniref:tagatose kinase n=1 Tax=Aureimonas psammosilenae TaxID=2495496 RepID=UPI00126085A5|nr:sugar kinase [Aureimonas psammosilenae]
MSKLVLTIGEILAEIIAENQGDGFLEPIPLTGPYPSGAPAIFIDQAARFGQPAAMIGCVGDDDFGIVNLDRLRRDGVDVSGIAVDPELPTGHAFVRYRPDGSRKFVYNIKHSASGRTRLTEAGRAVLGRADHLHVMGTALFSPSLIETALSAVDTVKTRGGTVSFDPNLRPEMLRLPGVADAVAEFLKSADLFLPSGEELFLFAPGKDEPAAIAELLDGGLAAIVLKRGSQGASYFDRERRIDQPAFRVEEIDPTGAGDCFGATFVSCWLQGLAPELALSYAAASGALAVTRVGPMEGTSTRAELDAFISRADTEKAR